MYLKKCSDITTRILFQKIENGNMLTYVSTVNLNDSSVSYRCVVELYQHFNIDVLVFFHTNLVGEYWKKKRL